MQIVYKYKYKRILLSLRIIRSLSLSLYVRLSLFHFTCIRFLFSVALFSDVIKWAYWINAFTVLYRCWPQNGTEFFAIAIKINQNGMTNMHCVVVVRLSLIEISNFLVEFGWHSTLLSTFHGKFISLKTFSDGVLWQTHGQRLHLWKYHAVWIASTHRRYWRRFNYHSHIECLAHPIHAMKPTAR